jgi:hypothetical protein
MGLILDSGAHRISEFSQLTDDEVYWALVSKGIERQFAARLVEFLPAAYCRIMLEPTGVRFPDTYQRPTSAPVPLASEPVWLAALDQVRREIANGLPGHEWLRLAARSAEFQATNDLLNKGYAG